MRADLNLPVFKVLSETEFTAPASANEISSLRPDTGRMRAPDRSRARPPWLRLIAEHGRITVAFFDEGESRRVPWPDRPQATKPRLTNRFARGLAPGFVIRLTSRIETYR